MEVLLDVLLAVHLADGRLGHNMVPVVEAIMLDVMAEGGHDQGNIVEVIKLGIFHQVLRLEDKANVLSHI